MNIQTIVKIISAVFGLLGVVFLFRIIGVGDEEIKMAASIGDYGVVSPLVSVAIAILFVTVAVTVVFSLINLASSPQKLKKSLLFILCFIVVIGLAFTISSGVETPLKDGEILSASGSRWVEAGIRMFYILAALAIGSMIFFGGKKLINK
ncbi:hypothetical protein N9799_01595 [Flavobacteriaceae bacterium]|jgi:uncharacterized membrane protein|nr:hypothetical protein [Flavobacteriaceae bacterium]MDA8848981.1 hypothetical protein [Flavobacteriaceae bacterium]MDB4227483.1 hypothetical protein [Flavobacteriaceae bacterium]MDB4235462.1 hypothetical protein [bacterium]MDC0001268.1 hypothetical protein [Flavobacteriaceae bacterium]